MGVCIGHHKPHCITREIHSELLVDMRMATKILAKPDLLMIKTLSEPKKHKFTNLKHITLSSPTLNPLYISRINKIKVKNTQKFT